MNSSMNTEKLRDHWVAELTPPPAAGADGAVSEPLLQALLRELGTTAVPILRPDPGHTWIWSDLHLGDLAMVEAWNRPFRNLTHMNRALLAEWRRRIRPSDTIICLGDVAHPDAWRDHSRLQLDRSLQPFLRKLRLHFNERRHTLNEESGAARRVVKLRESSVVDHRVDLVPLVWGLGLTVNDLARADVPQRRDVTG